MAVGLESLQAEKQELVQTLGKDLADRWLIQTLDHFEKPTVGLVLMCLGSLLVETAGA